MSQEDFIEGEAIPGEIKVGIFLKSYNVLNDTAEVSTDDKTTYSTGEGARVVKSELSRSSQRMAPEEEDAWGSPGYEVAE